MRIYTLMLASCFGSSGCAPAMSTPHLAHDAAPWPGSAYVYGTFAMDRATDLGIAFGLMLGCSDGKEYAMWFVDEQPLLMFEIAPATCSLKYYLYDNFAKTQQVPVSKKFLHNVEFRPGKAYYLGNLVAHAHYETRNEYSRGQARTVLYSAWEIANSSDEYEITTQIMRQKFTQFKSIETEKRLIDSSQLSLDDQVQERARVQKNDERRNACHNEFGTCRNRCGPAATDVACLRACRKSSDACLKEMGE